MLSIGEAATFLGVSRTSLRRWDNMDVFSACRTIGGHRRYKLSDLGRFYDHSDEPDPNSTSNQHILCYARVSGHKQKEKGDLQRQVEKLYSEAAKLGDTSPIMITDVGSGLNSNRSGLQRIFRHIKSGNVSQIIVTFKDRLTRFGFSFIQDFCQLFGVQICETHQSAEKTVQESLVDDMMSLIACFSGKLYGMRSAKSRKKRTQQKNRLKYFKRIINHENLQILYEILQEISGVTSIKSIKSLRYTV